MKATNKIVFSLLTFSLLSIPAFAAESGGQEDSASMGVAESAVVAAPVETQLRSDEPSTFQDAQDLRRKQDQ